MTPTSSIRFVGHPGLNASRANNQNNLRVITIRPCIRRYALLLRYHRGLGHLFSGRRHPHLGHHHPFPHDARHPVALDGDAQSFR